MLTRIQSVSGLGLLHAVKAPQHECKKVTLVYAENARGKTTFSSLIRSLATGDIQELRERSTISGTEPLGATLQFGPADHYTLTQSGWDKSNPDVVIFDGHFVETNVYSGATVSTQQRQQLLDFVLGDKAVAAQSAEAKAISDLAEAKANVKTKEAEVLAHQGGIALSDFRSLPDSKDFPADLAALGSRLHSAQNASTIEKTPVPSELIPPDLELDAIFETLGTTIEVVHDVAEGVLETHLESLGNGAAEWLAKGQPFDDHEMCPYCGQNTADVDLVKAYQGHFNDTYQALKESVDFLALTIESRLGDLAGAGLVDQIATTNGLLESWKEHCDTVLLADDGSDVWLKVSAVRVALEAVIASKKSRMTEFVPSGDACEAVRTAWAEVLAWYVAQNAVLTANAKAIDAYKTGLAGEDEEKLKAAVEKTRIAQARHSQPVKVLLADLDALTSAVKTAETAKSLARVMLTSLMTTTLKTYAAETNKYLASLGARFEIKEMENSYVGGARLVYSIDLLGQEISVDKGPRRFETTLSESDKRTLAFAFFLSSTLSDPQISSKVVVVDDPVSSLDEPRKSQTMDMLMKVESAAEQLIVLSHRIYFLRDLRRRFRSNSVETKSLTICRDGPIFSGIFGMDLEVECESGYFQQHRIIANFLSGDSTDAVKAATAIRKVGEGYMHRRFPGVLEAGTTLGSIVTAIDKAQPTEPLSYAKDIRDELEFINIYAREFHHETKKSTQPSADDATVTNYCQKVLAVIYGSYPP